MPEHDHNVLAYCTVTTMRTTAGITVLPVPQEYGAYLDQFAGFPFFHCVRGVAVGADSAGMGTGEHATMHSP